MVEINPVTLAKKHGCLDDFVFALVSNRTIRFLTPEDILRSRSTIPTQTACQLRPTVTRCARRAVSKADYWKCRLLLQVS